MKAPIIIEKSNSADNQIKPNADAREIIKNRSCLLSDSETTNLNTNLLIIIAVATMTAILPNTKKTS